MKLPFTTEQFLEIFRKYNTTFYPLQAMFLLLAVYIIFLLVRNKSNSGKTITTILAALWLWMGTAYHIAFFSIINKAAYIFGFLFILQGILLFIYGLVKAPSFVFNRNGNSFISASFGLCPNHLSSHRLSFRTRLPLLTHIWLAMPHNNFYYCHIFLGQKTTTILHHFNTAIIVSNRFFRCIQLGHL